MGFYTIFIVCANNLQNDHNYVAFYVYVIMYLYDS